MRENHKQQTTMNSKVQFEQEVWDRIKKSQEEFFEAFKEYDPDDVRAALNAHPENKTRKWDGVPLMVIAGFYAAWKETTTETPMYVIDELKAILDAKKEG